MLVFDYNLSEERVLNGSWFYLYQIIVEDGDSAWFYKFDSSKWVFLNDRNSFSFWAFDNANQNWRYFTKLPYEQSYMYMYEDFLVVESFPETGFTDAECYKRENVGKIGSWSGCDRMLIVDNVMLRGAASSNFWVKGDESFSITGPDGIEYTFENSSYNIFTGQVTAMSNLFYGTSFNGEINYWDVSSVTSMSNMFNGASLFNQSLNDWNVSSVTSMEDMFNGASLFNQPLNKWDVSSVRSVSRMFYNATSFNQPLNDWDISSVIFIDNVFKFASSFNQDLDKWCIVRGASPTFDLGLSSNFNSKGPYFLCKQSTGLTIYPVQAGIQELRGSGSVLDGYFYGSLTNFCHSKAASFGYVHGQLAHSTPIRASGGNHCDSFIRVEFSHNNYRIPGQCFRSPRNDYLRIYGDDGTIDIISARVPNNRGVESGATVYCAFFN